MPGSERVKGKYQQPATQYISVIFVILYDANYVNILCNSVRLTYLCRLYLCQFAL